MSVCASLSGVNINQELLRPRTALKVPLGTILPWLRGLGSVTLERQTERQAEERVTELGGWLKRGWLMSGFQENARDSPTSFLHF